MVAQGQHTWVATNHWLAPLLFGIAIAWPICVWQWKRIRKLLSLQIRISWGGPRPDTAPRPLITYDGVGVKLDGGWAELFEIYNDGPTTAAAISFGELQWVERRPFTLCRATPSVPTKNQCTAYLALNVPNGEHLGQFLHRAELKDAKPTVTVTFQDPGGNQFSCNYALCAGEGKRVIWNPSSVRRLKPL